MGRAGTLIKRIEEAGLVKATDTMSIGLTKSGPYIKFYSDFSRKLVLPSKTQSAITKKLTDIMAQEGGTRIFDDKAGIHVEFPTWSDRKEDEMAQELYDYLDKRKLLVKF